MWNRHWATCIPPSESTTRITKLWPLTPALFITYYNPHQTEHILLSSEHVLLSWSGSFFKSLHRRLPLVPAESRASPMARTRDRWSSLNLGSVSWDGTNTRLKPDDIFDLVFLTWQQSGTKELSFMIVVHQRWVLFNNRQLHPFKRVIHK